MSLLRYIVKRALLSIPLVIFATVLTFVIIQSAPGDPVSYLLSGFEHAPPGLVEAMRAEFGLDQPMHIRLLVYLRNVFTGNFGYSYIRRTLVITEIQSRLVNTLLLTVTGMVIELTCGILLGLIAARKAYSIFDILASTISMLLWSMPYFWIGIVTIIFFTIYVPIFPVGGMITPGVTGIEAYLDVAWHLFLPATVLGLGRVGLYTRMTRASLLEIMTQDYILTARAKGCDDRTVMTKHALRNALLPLVTLIGMSTSQLFMGTVLVEIVFGWPGMGTLIYDSIIARDYAMIQIAFLFMTMIVVFSNLCADIAYAIVDPRIRYA